MPLTDVGGLFYILPLSTIALSAQIFVMIKKTDTGSTDVS